MFDAIIIFSVLSLILGLVLGYAAIKFKIAPRKQKSIVIYFFWQEDGSPLLKHT
jgi:predicted permease